MTLNLDSVYLDDFSYINATNVVVQVRDTTLELSVANTLVIAEADLGTDLGLMACAEGDSLILPAGVSVRELQVDSLQGALTLTGDSLTLDMTALDLSGADAVKVSCTGDVTMASADSMVVTALLAGTSLTGYYSPVEDGCWYFVQSVPEPATATLSLMALAALAVRRRRR